jgi:acyl transferase domain-containing protein
VAAVLLKRLADARRDGDRVLAVVRGCAGAADRHQPKQAIGLAMRRALIVSGKTATDVAEIEAAACGVPTLDAGEIEAIRETYGAAPRSRPLLLGSTVAQFGHTQGAQGLVSLIKATLALEHGEIPPNFGHARPGPLLAADSLCRAVDRATSLPPAEEAETSLGVSAMAFNGLAWHALLDRGVTVAAKKTPSVTEVRGKPSQTVSAGPRRVAFLFPGQGSQYVGMMRETLRDVPAAETACREMDAVMKRLGYPSFADLAWSDDDRLGKDVWHTQAAMLLADLIQLAALKSMGVKPDVVAGHSYGEFTALVAAGAVNSP